MQTVQFVLSSSDTTSHSLKDLEDFLLSRYRDIPFLALAEGGCLTILHKGSFAKTFQIGPGQINTMTQLNSGQIVVAMHSTIFILSTKTYEKQQEITSHTEQVSVMKQLLNDLLVSGDIGGSILVHSIFPTPKLLYQTRCTGKSIYQIEEIDKDNIRFSSYNQPIVDWHYRTGILSPKDLWEHSQHILATCMLKDGLFAYGGRSIPLFIVKENTKYTLNTTNNIFQIIQLKDGSLVTRHAQKPNIAIWDLGTKHIRTQLSVTLSEFDWNPQALIELDEETIACRTNDGVWIINSKTGNVIKKIPKKTRHATKCVIAIKSNN
jgi:hypothetical protein